MRLWYHKAGDQQYYINKEGIMLEEFGFLNIGVQELLLVLLIALLLFGSRKLPELAKSLGTSARELRKGLNDSDEKQKQTDQKTRSESTS